MSSVTPVTKDSLTYALFVCGRPPVDGAKFLTENADEFQVGIMERPKGYDVKPHQHPARSNVISRTTEFLYIEEGKVEATVFDEDWKEIGRQILSAGDFLVFFRGGHTLTMIEPTRLVEVKQGPFLGDAKGKTFR